VVERSHENVWVGKTRWIDYLKSRHREQNTIVRGYWLGEYKLKDKYPKIFVNSNQKEALVLDVGEWQGNKLEKSMNWRKKLV